MENTAKKIFGEQTRLLYANSMMPIVVSLVAALLLCWSLQGLVGQTVLVAWFTLFFALSVARLILLFLFHKRTITSGKEERWHNHFLITTYAIAALWGSASFFLFPEQSHSQQIVFFMILLGIAAGAIASLCPSLPAVSGFLSLLLIPLMVKMVILGNPEALFKGALLLLFWTVILAGAVRINNNIRENIELHLHSVARENILKVSEERYRHIFSHAPLGIFHYNAQGVIIDCNDELVSILHSSRDLLVGLDLPAKLKDQQMLNAIKDSLKGGEGYYEGDYAPLTSDTVTPVRIFFKAIRSTEKKIIGGVGIVEDCTEKKQADQLIHYHASYDPLTGLANRRLLLDHLNSEITRAKRHRHFGALLFIDLDNFKTINDSLGHSVGDELLKVVAKRITDNIRKEDTAARMGGDEFIIIITELDVTIGLASYKARGVAEKLSRGLSGICQIGGHELHVTPSIGVSIFPSPDKEADDILKQADSAMYRAKASGRNAIRFFLPHMQEVADQRLHLNMELRKALDNDQFCLYYQPQVDLSGNLVGAEALIRWQHPERGIIPPAAFLEVAEETGLMPEIGQWVLQEACRHIKNWRDTEKLKDIQTISVNISGKEITSPGYIDTVIGILRDTGADPNHLGIELTEGSLIPTGGDIVESIITLREMGVKFSVDDFGTGYSSLSYLQSLPLHTLKIDRSFVNNIKDDSRDVVLVDTIISMAHNLGLEVVAEGVETEQELLYLNTRGCVVYQGFYFSKPVSVTVFTKMLETGSSYLPEKSVC